mmetsp:Transcript_71301/g.104479  ORF Transcript_71301/g.104479 Transcript_71301/m.104479 type:complete len:344 (+) Transcript_71301:547-1578(+)
MAQCGPLSTHGLELLTLDLIETIVKRIGIFFVLTLRLKLLLLALKFFKHALNFGINKVGNVFAIHNLGDGIELPVLVLETKILLTEVHRVHTSTTVLKHNLFLQLARRVHCRALGHAHLHRAGDDRGTLGAVARFRHRDVNTRKLINLMPSLFGPVGLASNTLGKESIAGRRLETHHTVLSQGRARDKCHIVALHRLDQSFLLLRALLHGFDVTLVEHNHERLALKEGLDVVEQRHLLLDRIAALLGKVNKVEHARLQMHQCGNRLHLDGVALLEGVIQNARSVNNLPPEILVVHVAHEERLGSERVRLNLALGTRHLVHKGGLAHIGVPAHEKRACVRVDRG